MFFPGSSGDECSLSEFLLSPYLWLLSVSYLVVFGVKTACTDWGQLFLVQDRGQSMLTGRTLRPVWRTELPECSSTQLLVLPSRQLLHERAGGGGPGGEPGCWLPVWQGCVQSESACFMSHVPSLLGASVGFLNACCSSCEQQGLRIHGSPRHFILICMMVGMSVSMYLFRVTVVPDSSQVAPAHPDEPLHTHLLTSVPLFARSDVDPHLRRHLWLLLLRPHRLVWSHSQWERPVQLLRDLSRHRLAAGQQWEHTFSSDTRHQSCRCSRCWVFNVSLQLVASWPGCHSAPSPSTTAGKRPSG